MSLSQQRKYVPNFNNLINTIKKEQSLETGEKYPWLDDIDKRKYMTDREILEKYINLDNTCLTEKEKEEGMDMLYKYKEAFSLRDDRYMPKQRGRNRCDNQIPILY